MHSELLLDNHIKTITTEHNLIDDIFNFWEKELGEYYQTYKNHVLRVFNYIHFLSNPCGEFNNKLIIAICHQRIGHWFDKENKDCLNSSLKALSMYLKEKNLYFYYSDISKMISDCYSFYKVNKNDNLSTQVIKKAFTIDFSYNQISHIPKDYYLAVNNLFPYLNFHSFIINLSFNKFVNGFSLQHFMNNKKH